MVVVMVTAYPKCRAPCRHHRLHGSRGHVAGDLGPEGLVFVPAEDSPNSRPLLIVMHKISGSVALYQVVVN